MKRLLLTNWHFMRFLRLGLATFLFVQACITREWMFGAFGLFFLFQAVFNLGCGPNGCSVNYDKKK
ncbi:hypothetical protein [Flavobacterium sp.]|uniref:hypothetical protein n=1 Tax=Flavobacterium sp. TaxID=239 RepID=UPI002B4AC857|nr:hypothetical protein [Flavobacterium sp.]HLP64767.1 hypothetical protein [Flavobacterium sp.]